MGTELLHRRPGRARGYAHADGAGRAGEPAETPRPLPAPPGPETAGRRLFGPL
ncbi:hypothetical protein GCM10010517_09420 [Streptosporangium fragile]|uniref:Uncharacterized protein n=1 Tax=Streptosporangium fragile TaxID=46186 RepID=A0ABN3VS97_9ACTN